jgi:hypothetical protein
MISADIVCSCGAVAEQVSVVRDVEEVKRLQQTPGHGGWSQDMEKYGVTLERHE